jgi:hypothetical protein
LPFSLKSQPKLLPLRLGQVHCFVLTVQREEPNLIVLRQVHVDDAKSTTFPLATRVVTPPQLPETAGARHDGSGVRALNQKELQAEEPCIVQVPGHVSRERRGLEELHA